MAYYGDYSLPRANRFEEPEPRQYQQPRIVERQPPQEPAEEKTFFESKGIWLILAGIAAYYFKWFELNFVLAYVFVVIAWGLWEIGNKYIEQKPSFPYKPFEISEIPELEHRLLEELGRRIELSSDRMLGEPEFESGSAEPYAMHFLGIETLDNGLKVPTHVAISLRTPKKRSFIRIEKNHRHVETAHNFWTGSLKPTAPALPPSTREMIYVPSPTPITASSPEAKEDKENEKEENGGD